MLNWEKTKGYLGFDEYVLRTPIGDYWLEQYEKTERPNVHGRYERGRYEGMKPNWWVSQGGLIGYVQGKNAKTLQEEIETLHRNLVSQCLEQCDIGLVLHEDEI